MTINGFTGVGDGSRLAVLSLAERAVILEKGEIAWIGGPVAESVLIRGQLGIDA
jgi:hypothetical protein